jgi:hypothetical protein
MLLRTLSYDSLNRVIKITDNVYSPPPDTMVFTYLVTYSPSEIVFTKTISTSPSFYEKLIYSINSIGLAEEHVIIDYSGNGDSTIQVNYTYQYNQENYLTQMTGVIPGGTPGTWIFEYVDKNVESLDYSPSGTNTKQVFSYDLNYMNTIGNENVGAQFLGKSCYNPIIRSVFESPNFESARYTYTYDANNRISQIVMNGNAVMPNLSWISVPRWLNKQILNYSYY